MSESSLANQLRALVSQRKVYHPLVWLSYILFLFLLNTDGELWQFTLLSILIHTSFLATLVYLNIFYLLPKYFSPNRFGNYFGHLLFFTLAFTPLELLALYLQMSNYPWAQAQLLQNQTIHWLVLFFGTLSSTIFKITREWFQQNRIRRDLEKKTLQSELRFLRAQIQPHFLFNTLNSIYALSLKKSDKAPEMILRLSEMLRYMLYECSESRVALSREIQYLHNYLAMEHLRHGAQARIFFECETDDTQYQIAPLLLSPFLENAFKHGMDSKIDEAFVEAELYAENGSLEFTVRNSVSPKDSPKPTLPPQKGPSGGIGLQNVQRRLDLLYPNAYTIEVSDLDEIYVIYLKIQLI